MAKSPVQSLAPKPRRSNSSIGAGTSHAEASVKVLRRVRSVFNAVKTHFRQVEKKAGIGGAQLWALGLMEERSSIGIGDLARAMDIHQSTASNLVKGLVSQGLVTVARSEHDRRASLLQVTAQGRQVLKKAPGPFAGVLPEALAALDLDTLESLDRDLGKLLTLLKADKRSESIPLAQM